MKFFNSSEYRLVYPITHHKLFQDVLDLTFIGAAGVLFIVISLMLGIVIRNWRRKNYSSPNGRAEVFKYVLQQSSK